MFTRNLKYTGTSNSDISPVSYKIFFNNNLYTSDIIYTLDNKDTEFTLVD